MIAALLLAAAAASTVSSTVATSRGDQPLVVYPPAAPRSGEAKPLVLVLSGEGGWRSFDDTIARALSGAGYWVGGVNCMKYFWGPQDDREQLASDMRAFVDALATSASAPKDARVVLAGYSFGADVAPWIAGAPHRDPRIAALVLIGPDVNGSLEFRLSEMMGMVAKQHVFDTAHALADVKDLPVLFIHGGGDPHSDGPALARGFAGRKELVVIPGASHHFSGHEGELGRAIVDGLERLLRR